MINQSISIPSLPHKKCSNHQLSYQGCRCPICLKINVNETSQIIFQRYLDNYSQGYKPHHHKEVYLEIINQLAIWDKFPRKLRLTLPQICVFLNGMPDYWVTKNRQNAPTKIIRAKSKMNMFEIQHFFLEGYLFHNPQIINKKREKNNFKEKSKSYCIVAAKYQRNATQLLTLDQIENLFKSKYKYMRDGLMYLQTFLGANNYHQYNVKIDLENIQKQNPCLFQRAKQEAKIFVNETKITDSQYYPQKNEMEYEKQLLHNIEEYLLYLSLKITFIISKTNTSVMSQSVFKWASAHRNYFLWDIRAQRYLPSSKFWQNSVVQALQIKLKKTMSMMQLDNSKQVIDEQKLSYKARSFQEWLENSTQNQWNQMKVIRARLEKLESQKKALIQSQRESIQNTQFKSFRMRTKRKKQSFNQTNNPQF